MPLSHFRVVRTRGDGALAAEKVIETAREHFHAGPTPDPGAFLEGLCLESHRAINNLGEDEQRSPGSTCVMLYLNGPEAYWAHVGDSRMYHFRGGELLNRTCDHSVAQLLVSEGRLNEADAASSPMQNQLYMRLGGNNMPIPELGASIVEDSEFFLLCSDGLSGMCSDEELLEIVIDADGHYFIDEQQVVNTELNTLKGAIREALGERESVPVMIRADARTPHQAVVRALDATSQLGLVNISLATSKIEE